MELIQKYKDPIIWTISGVTIIASSYWISQLSSQIGVSNWECYASRDKKNTVPTAIHHQNYMDISSGFENVCRSGISVAVWLIFSGLTAIVLTFTRKYLNELAWRSILFLQLALTLLALIWLGNATVLRFGHVGKVCSGDFYELSVWGYPGPYLYEEGQF